MPQGYKTNNDRPMRPCDAEGCCNLLPSLNTGGTVAPGDWCSKQCLWRTKSRNAGPSSVRKRRARGRKRYQPRKKHRFTCAVCSAERWSYYHHTRYCSKPCARLARRRREAKLDEARVVHPYTIQEVGERDRWICHLCGRRTARPGEHPDYHPDKPHIDHLVPVSQGGDDAPWNVAIAHAICNMRKHTSAANEQLRLPAPMP